MINILLGILQLISIMIIVVYEYKQKSLAMFLWATLLLIFGMPHLLLIISGTSDYNSNVTIKASLFVLLFNIIYLMSKTILCRFFSRNNGVKKNKIKSVKNDLIKNNDRINKKMIILFFFLLLLSFFILIYYSKKYLGGISNSSWGQFRKINKEMGFRSLIRYGTLVFLVPQELD